MKIEYELPSTVKTRDPVVVEGTELLYLIEGRLKIYGNARCFFEDPYMNMVEFAAYSYRWLYVNGATSDFVFESIDHDEPILVFRHVNGERWIVDSIWKRSEELQVTKQELISVLAEFLTQIERYLVDQYGLTIEALAKQMPYTG